MLYAWLWALTPIEEPTGDDDPVTRVVPVAVLLVALQTLAAFTAVWVHLGGGDPPVPLGALVSAVAAICAVAWMLTADRRDPRWRASAPVIRIASAAILIAEGILLLIGQSQPAAAVVAVFLLVVGAAILFIPRVVALWNELVVERTARMRQEQRAEIAAHLHDSVLQTLALIQNRAGPQSEVARIARAQERELRDWLFAGTDPFAEDLGTELRSIATQLELEYAVRIEVVTAGDVTGIVSPALSGATREAMLNAARHAGGDVTVFVEAAPTAVDVFVRDHGPGFDLDRVPDGRLGVRESIVGRMTRAGGSAIVTTGADGTEIQLHLETGVRA